jgi:hypothetical protein
MPAVPRELSVSYAGVTVGGASDGYLLHGKYQIDDSYDRARATFHVQVVGSTEAEFAARCAALEAAYRTPRGTLTVALGAQTLTSFSHAASSGYSAVPSIRKVGDDFDSGRTRLYECSVEVERPADLAGQSHRRSSTVAVSTEPGRRRILTVSGRYTANGATGARAQYEASIDAYVAAVIASVGGTWKRTVRQADADDPNKNLDFREEYEQLLAQDADPGAAVYRSVLHVSQATPAIGDSPDFPVQRLLTLRASYDGWVDLSAAQPRPTFDASIRPWITNQVQRAFAPSGLALIDEDVVISALDGHVSATLSYHAVSRSGTMLAYLLTVEVSEDLGRTITPTWEQDELSAVVFPAPGRLVRTISEQSQRVSDQRTVSAALSRKPNMAAHGRLSVEDGVTRGWVTVSRTTRETPRRIGRLDSFIDVIERDVQTVQQYVESTAQLVQRPR